MVVFSILIILFILSVWILTAVQQLFSAKKETGGKRWLVCVASILMAVGAIGFFGAALSSTGGLNWLPSSFEWPVGRANGVVSVNGYFVVPHTPSGRVQIYDNHWKFIRGWHVDAGGGTFKLKTSDQDHIDVITARGQWHYIFDLSGKLLSKEQYSPASTYSSFRSEGQSYVVPTFPWLWVFSNPFYSWLSGILGIALFIAKDKISGRKTKTSPPARD
jgi:hypothetical protein